MVWCVSVYIHTHASDSDLEEGRRKAKHDPDPDSDRGLENWAEMGRNWARPVQCRLMELKGAEICSVVRRRCNGDEKEAYVGLTFEALVTMGLAERDFLLHLLLVLILFVLLLLLTSEFWSQSGLAIISFRSDDCEVNRERERAALFYGHYWPDWCWWPLRNLQSLDQAAWSNLEQEVNRT